MSAGPRTPNRDIIVIGGSAGALRPLRTILAGVRPDLPVSVFVVIHGGDREPNLLPAILDAAGPLPVVTASDGQRFQPGFVYLPPTDRHLLVGADHIHVRRGSHKNRTRPAVDPLFRSAAAHASTRVIGIVLSAPTAIRSMHCGRRRWRRWSGRCTRPCGPSTSRR